jgi:transcriptional regulator with XRE-family HTH domain
MLREMRQKAGLTQRDLAKKLRVTHVWVHKNEIGERRMDMAEFMDWCLSCGVDPEQAFHELRSRRSL